MEKIEYYSSDKLYKIKKRRLSNKGVLTVSIISTVLLLIISAVCFNESVNVNSKDGLIGYSENGNIDYKVYLNDTGHFDTSYLGKGMQYVASTIKTINVKFDYQIHSEEDLDFTSKYKVVGELRITDRYDTNKVQLSKKENIVTEKTITKTDDNIVVSEELDIDYNKYNQIVSTYKKDYGVSVASNLVLTLEVDTEGLVEGEKEGLNRENKLQMSIPLSEQTVDIALTADNIDYSGKVLHGNKLFEIDNMILFIVFILLALLTLGNIIIDLCLAVKYSDNDIYRSKLNKILKQYDRIIVNGKMSIDENNYTNKIYPESFEEMVDAAQQLEVPIHYYEPIPNEKSFFIVAKNNTLYKYRLSRAFLERNKAKGIQDDIDRAQYGSGDKVNRAS